MSRLRCLSFNCRGWNSGCVDIGNFIDGLDICMIQEHWLLHDQLHVLSSYHKKFDAIGVSGVNSDELLFGRPYGGCAILYRKSFSSCILPLKSHSKRCCGLKITCTSGFSIYLLMFTCHLIIGCLLLVNTLIHLVS